MQPLKDTVVVDLSQNLAGPFCAQILADMGADVVKVEPPGRGDAAREWGPPFWGGEATIFMAGNRNKRSVAVNVKSSAGRDVVRRLAARADVFIHSFRAGTTEKLELDYERLRATNPRLIYCSITAFGVRGPLKDLPGYDPLLQAYGGLMSITGHHGQPPTRIGTSIVDMGTGMWAALGVVAALRERQRTDEGSHIVTSLFDTALMWVSYHAMGYLATGAVPGRLGSGLAMIAPYEAFPTSDGHVMIAAGTDGLFESACDALGIPHVAEDPRFRSNPCRVEHRAELFDALAEVTRRETARAVLQRLQAAGVPCAPILPIDEVVAEPQVRENGMLISAPHPRIPDYRSIALPVEWNGARAPILRVPPLVGEHTDEVLRKLGYTADEIDRLERDCVVERRVPRSAAADPGTAKEDK